MKVYELETALNKHGAGPLYLISGEEDYLRDQAIVLIKKAVFGRDTAGTDEFNLDVLYGDEIDASEILCRAGEVPAFAARRLVIVKAAERIPARDGDALLPYVHTPCDTTTLVFVTPKLDGRTKFAAGLKDRAVVVDCSPLPDHQISSWIRAEAGRLGMRIREDAVLLLHDMVASGSLALVKQELEKLASYVSSDRMVGPADVQAVRGSEVGASVFDLAAAIGAQNRERVLHILARNLEAGEAPLRMLGSLVWQYRQLWKAKDLLSRSRNDYEAGRMLRMPPFKAREFLGRFSDAHLRTAFQLFLHTDSKLKGGTPGLHGRVLEALLLDLCKKEMGKNPPVKGEVRYTGQPADSFR